MRVVSQPIFIYVIYAIPIVVYEGIRGILRIQPVNHFKIAWDKIPVAVVGGLLKGIEAPVQFLQSRHPVPIIIDL